MGQDHMVIFVVRLSEDHKVHSFLIGFFFIGTNFVTRIAKGTINISESNKKCLDEILQARLPSNRQKYSPYRYPHTKY